MQPEFISVKLKLIYMYYSIYAVNNYLKTGAATPMEDS